MMNTTEHQLNDLGLRGMARALVLQRDNPAALQLGFEERLGMMLDAEVAERDSRRIERLLKAAKLRFGQASLEDVDFRPGRKLDRQLLMSLADCAWIQRRNNLILTGATGTGKSWLACALGNQACRAGMMIYYTTSTKLFEDLSIAMGDGSLPKLRRQLIKLELLIIDDVGIGGIDVALGPTLLEIIDLQSVNGSLLLTSQFPPDRWYDLFNDPTVADAILDRVVHRAHRLELHGESMRKLRGTATEANV